MTDQQGFSDDQGYQGGYEQAFPQRRRSHRPPSLRPGGRHRRDVPATLPQDAPALVLAVPGDRTDLASGTVGELLTIIRVDNPAADVRGARIEGQAGDPEGLRAVLAAAAAAREGSAGPSAVVVPLLATPNPPVVRKLREAIADSGVNAMVSGFVDSNALIAEALHIRLAEAGLARADRVRLFSIVTAADGIIVATVGGPDGAQAANVTSVLLAARLALPVFTASLDSAPSVADVALRLKEMGVARPAVAPCIIGPEATRAQLDAAAAAGAESAGLIGAHGNIAKLIAMAYGNVLDQLEALAVPEEEESDVE